MERNSRVNTLRQEISANQEDLSRELQEIIDTKAMEQQDRAFEIGRIIRKNNIQDNNENIGMFFLLREYDDEEPTIYQLVVGHQTKNDVFDKITAKSDVGKFLLNASVGSIFKDGDGITAYTVIGIAENKEDLIIKKSQSSQTPPTPTGVVLKKGTKE